MPESLLYWYTNHLENPNDSQRRLKGRAMFVYEPRMQTAEEEEDNQLRTRSGLTSPAIGGGEALAVPIEKSKANGFLEKITLGRTSNNDIIVDDGSVSRFHAWIEIQEANYFYFDAGSRNGSVVDGQRLEAKSRCALRSGAKVRVGSVELVFYLPREFFGMLKARG
jgi:pSer/pThr/pTyr-binding forkhead associated (FHA) protein